MAKQMAPDPAIGTWKLNVAKSSFKLTPPLKSSVGKVEAWEGGLKGRTTVPAKFSGHL